MFMYLLVGPSSGWTKRDTPPFLSLSALRCEPNGEPHHTNKEQKKGRRRQAEDREGEKSSKRGQHKKERN